MLRVLVTGVYGFIGSHFARLMSKSGYKVIGFGRDSHQKNKVRLCSAHIDIVHGDLAGDISGLVEDVDIVVNFAAKTFVDHSIKDPESFVRSNIIGTYNLLEQCRLYKPALYIQISTDEVYGSILDGAYYEDAPLNPTNPYAATKAAGDMLALSYFNTYGIPVIVTRTENNYGYFQHPQKVFPHFVRRALANEPLPVYGDGKHSRMWLRVEDHCEAIKLLIETENEKVAGQIFHIAGSEELQNLQLADMILKTLDKPRDRIRLVPDHDVRPGHDRRYALNSDKIKALGWKPKWSLEAGVKDVVEWYAKNDWWLS